MLSLIVILIVFSKISKQLRSYYLFWRMYSVITRSVASKSSFEQQELKDKCRKMSESKCDLGDKWAWRDSRDQITREIIYQDKEMCPKGNHRTVFFFFLKLFFFFFLAAACGILFPKPGIQLAPPALGAQNLNHCTAKEVPIG